MTSDNPQRQFKGGAPIPRPPKQRYTFEPGKGMVPIPGPPGTRDDIDPEMLYDVNEAILDSEDEAKRRRSYANVGYASMKRRG